MTGRRAVAVVALGGALGTMLRALAGWVLPDGTLPWSTLLVNVVGAFLLGVLLEGLALVSASGVPHVGWRLFLGTGVLGGLTTYSALAVGTDALARAGLPALAFGYAVGTVAAGLVACAAGMAVVTVGVRVWRGPRPDPDVRGVES